MTGHAELSMQCWGHASGSTYSAVCVVPRSLVFALSLLSVMACQCCRVWCSTPGSTETELSVMSQTSSCWHVQLWPFFHRWPFDVDLMQQRAFSVCKRGLVGCLWLVFEGAQDMYRSLSILVAEAWLQWLAVECIQAAGWCGALSMGLRCAGVQKELCGLGSFLLVKVHLLCSNGPCSARQH